jgi:site-specific DNA-methyltransferase (adenine-specific)
VNPRNTILHGDAASVLAGLAPDSVDCVVTSPPYFNLRYYGDQPDQLGLEPTVGEYVDALARVCRELSRVLKPTGTLWLVLRDSYSRAHSWGAAPKSLLLAPERLLIALQCDGWIVRNRIVWAKPNPMPEQTRDRLAVAHEDVLLLTRSARYYFDLDAIRIPHTSRPARPTSPPAPRARRGRRDGTNGGLGRLLATGRVGHPNGKNPGSVWSVGSAAYRGAHFATFPAQLIERPILAACPERVCAACKLPWHPSYKRPSGGEVVRYAYRPACGCGAGFTPGLVLDPFFGTGTVGAVAKRLHRDWLGIELNPDYHALAWQRLAQVDGRTASGRESLLLSAGRQSHSLPKEVKP